MFEHTVFHVWNRSMSRSDGRRSWGPVARLMSLFAVDSCQWPRPRCGKRWDGTDWLLRVATLLFLLTPVLAVWVDWA